jgi:hypothetical protein
MLVESQSPQFEDDKNKFTQPELSSPADRHQDAQTMTDAESAKGHLDALTKRHDELIASGRTGEAEAMQTDILFAQSNWEALGGGEDAEAGPTADVVDLASRRNPAAPENYERGDNRDAA